MKTISDLKKKLKNNHIDVAIFLKNDSVDDKSIYYLTGINPTAGFLFVFAHKKPILFITALDQALVQKNSSVDIKIFDGNTSPFSILTHEQNIALHEDILPKKSYMRIRSMIKKYTSSSKKIKYRFKDVSSYILELRKQKNEQEIERIKKGVIITESIFKALFKELKKNRSKFKKESDIVHFLKIAALNKNCDIAFAPVVASGSHAKSPHYYPNAESLQKGFCVIDFGVMYEGYCTDMTRTIYFGIPSIEEKKMYDSVVAALEDVEQKIISGINCKTIFRDFQKEHFPMIHALGHGVGLDVHEYPLIANSKHIFTEGNIIALEPAIYSKINKTDFGIRVEDMFLVGKKKLLKLNTLSRKLKTF